MTTICSDGKTVAADGLLTDGDEPVRFNAEKIRPGPDGAVIGFTGAEHFFKPAVDWYMAGHDPESMPKTPAGDMHEWRLAIFNPDVVEVFRSDCPYPVVYPYPTALGSGAEYALGALAACAPPEQAVRIAMRFNIKTGGKVTVLPIGAAEMQEAAE